MSQLPPKGKPEQPALAVVVDDGETNEHMKAMWAGQSNVLVSVRVRPLMKHDIVKKSCVRVLDGKVVVILDPASGDKQDILRANRNREKQYAFDYVFEPSAKQDSVYNNTTKFLIHGVLDGYNATVFAYGQTGSGKTHTMIGTQSDPGIMVRVMEDLFLHSHAQGKQQGVQYKVTVSFLEVYNENIRDLLSDVEEYLNLREDPIKGPVVASITEIEATSGQEVMQLLHQGNSKRSQAATAANEVSSRSHAVLQVVVECRDRAPGTVANIKVGKLSLVDLAGSERAANTKNVGARLVEGANINRSLLALGNCINALGEKGNKGNFVPYRDSKLTRLLKDSLGGNCRTVMIANISAAESSFEETLNTLKYANRAKNIKTNVQRNVLNVNYHISEYVELINNLRNEIQILKSQIGGVERSPTAHGGLSLDPPHNNNYHHHHFEPPEVREVGLRILTPAARSPAMRGPSTPFQVLRESLKSGANEGRELVQQMRQKIVENFQERMQLRRSLIELEDQNVQNSIEVSKRQLLVIQWSEKTGHGLKRQDLESKADLAAYIFSEGNREIVEAWQECEQLRKAIIKNNGMKKNIAKRLRLNEKEAENFREELGDKITGEDRRELMSLQYQVGRLELENMELEQHRIVHESILKGKDLQIQKLKLQLAVREKVINRQQQMLKEQGVETGGYDLKIFEESLLGDIGGIGGMGGLEGMGMGEGMDESMDLNPSSPPRNMSDMVLNITPLKSAHNNNSKHPPSHPSSTSKKPPIPTLPIQKVEEDEDDGEEEEEEEDMEQSLPPSYPSSRVPLLPSLPLPNSNNNSNTMHSTLTQQTSSTMEEEDYYDAQVPLFPLSEREVALTSRDRDLIEEGEWTEIQSELSDNSSTFYDHPRGGAGAGEGAKGRGKVGGSKKKGGAAAGGVYRKNVSLNPPPGAAPSSSLASASTSNPPKGGVHNPRGGRLYRSSIKSDDPPPSDEEPPSLPSHLTPSIQKKQKHYISPRGGPPSNIPPINSNNNEEIGVLSGRRYGGRGAGGGGGGEPPVSLYDFSPRTDQGGGYAAIYPLNSHNSNSSIGGAGSGGIAGGENQKGGVIRSTALSVINSHGKLKQEEDLLDLFDTPPGEALVIRSKSLLKPSPSHNSNNNNNNSNNNNNINNHNNNSNNNNANAPGLANLKSKAPLYNPSLGGGSNQNSDASLMTIEGLSAVNASRPQRFKPMGRKSLLKSALSPGDDFQADPSTDPSPDLSLNVKMKSLPQLKPNLSNIVSPRRDQNSNGNSNNVHSSNNIHHNSDHMHNSSGSHK